MNWRCVVHSTETSHESFKVIGWPLKTWLLIFNVQHSNLKVDIFVVLFLYFFIFSQLFAIYKAKAYYTNKSDCRSSVTALMHNYRKLMYKTDYLHSGDS